MNRRRRPSTTNLKELYARSLNRHGEDFEKSASEFIRDNKRKLTRLEKRGVVTTGDLAEQLTQLPPKLTETGIHLSMVCEIREAIPALLELVSDSKWRNETARALYRFNSDHRVKSLFLNMGNEELGSATPDHSKLEAVVDGLKFCEDRRAVDLTISIFERTDLPGWLRGWAADALGCCAVVNDRRTTLFRRARNAAIGGLKSDSIDVQFWSMYLIASLSNHGYPLDKKSQRARERNHFARALPRLCQIAKNDKRLAPGFWWPMFSEAEDAIGCITTGRWPDPCASERWPPGKTRGTCNRK